MPFDNPPDGRFGDIELLWDARRRIGDTSRWVQGRYSDGDSLCLVAALSVAAGSQSFNTPNRTERRLARLVAAQLPQRVPPWARLQVFTARQRLMWFNDSLGTRHEDVVTLLDSAISSAARQAPIYQSSAWRFTCIKIG